MSPVVQTVLGPGNRRKPRLDPGHEFHQRHAGILADRHARGSGMVLLAFEFDPEPSAADDRRDDADPQMVIFQVGTLLDMGFQVAPVAGGIDLLPRPAGEPRLAQRITQATPRSPG